VASECAGEQNAFWEYEDQLYARQEQAGTAALEAQALSALASDLGLDVSRFGSCLQSGRYDEVIQKETNAAEVLGVLKTPTFLVNGRPVEGALPYDQFRQVIEDALEDASGRD
jgi:protein-disulfide isomerase